ncbi:hypothetical protein GOB93_14140 [Acetobacter musti]|uniref:Histidine kinase n=1 Tax=Acetobacter musti TaxID=864732 RepID=A0ABX0JUU2_9PROT|nr:hypothetical protein [Acetobacter musti]NHN85773.1 hypothetical protein [Acetobacter musti]
MPHSNGMAFNPALAGDPGYVRAFFPPSKQRDQKIVAGVVARLESAARFAREQLATLDDTSARLKVHDVIENIEACAEEMREDAETIGARRPEDQ